MKKITKEYERNIMKVGDSKVIGIPSNFDRYIDIEKKEKFKLGLYADDDGLLIVMRKK